MSEPTAVLSAHDLEVRYHGGPQPAVRGVSLSLAGGQGLLISGGGGSGKTSLLRGLLGLVGHHGSVSLNGHPPASPATRGQIGYGPQGDRFAPGLRVREAVSAAGALRGPSSMPLSAVTGNALERAGLAFVGDWRTSRLDAEGWRRLSLALAIIGDPTLVILDDPWTFADTLREIAAARTRGAAVLVAAQRPAGLAPALGRRIVLADGVAR